MNTTARYIVTGIIVLAALTGLVLGITVAFQQPSGSDLVALTAFLTISGGITITMGLAVSRLGLPAWGRSMQGRLVLASVLTAVLALSNVGFVALLMFLSAHDLVILMGMLAFALGMSTFASFAFSASTGRSMRAVVDAVRRVSEGSLSERVPVNAGDEVGELAAAFNGMAQRLEVSFNRGCELEQARRELITAVSHDLRTPLASIRVMVESINDGVVADEATIKCYMLTTQTEVETLSRLIDDLFELAQLDAGVLEIHTEEASIQDLISDTLESMAAQAVSHHLTLEGSADLVIEPVEVDARRLQRVLCNLVQNAIRHTPADGAIFIRAVDAGNTVEVQVSDTGEGISEEELERIFQRSYRPDRSRSRDSGGAGLGLSIAKGIVEAHAGRIWAQSNVGQGSVFRFTLPKAKTTVRA